MPAEPEATAPATDAYRTSAEPKAIARGDRNAERACESRCVRAADNYNPNLKLRCMQQECYRLLGPDCTTFCLSGCGKDMKGTADPSCVDDCSAFCR